MKTYRTLTTIPLLFLILSFHRTSGQVDSLSIAQESAKAIINCQIDAFNSGDLESFVSCFTTNVVVREFPNDTLYVGAERMKANYGPYMKNTPDTRVRVVKRMIIGNTVIDEEIATDNSQKTSQAAIYEIRNGKIGSMTFIHERKEFPRAQEPVQGQLDAYNARNIDSFLAMYSNEVEVYEFPGKLLYQGKEKMRDRYTRFFESSPNLNCTLKNRMVIGNTVIDEEQVRANASFFHAVAIYEVSAGRIDKVTFIR
ncbi:MAG: nuclear transport factor 2 family protein [Bacteroidota bacterium]